MLHEITIHGHRLSYRTAGAGPVMVLVHGMARGSDSWEAVIASLAEHHTVVAPDLLGHGASAKPQTDYSIGAHACTLRDLLGALGHERASFVGHSLGGGVAMQFAYQFPERCERLVLVSSGGLGREVHPILRALALPGAELVLPLVGGKTVRSAVTGVAHALGHLGLHLSPGMHEVCAALISLGDEEGRRAFLHTLRAVIGPAGQRVSATNRLYLAAALPTLVVWGARDPIIPVSHAHVAHAAIAGSRLELFPDAGHFPHCDDPRRFVETVRQFVESTDPLRLDEQGWRNFFPLRNDPDEQREGTP
jgi:pimeloyl-ACP methyl ester carboxylesterase